MYEEIMAQMKMNQQKMEENKTSFKERVFKIDNAIIIM